MWELSWDKNHKPMSNVVQQSYLQLERWFTIDKCQACEKKKKGCLKQNIAKRHLIDYTKGKQVKLFICFIDFSKAYDRILRPILFILLAKLGCGHVMLSAIQAIYKSTKNLKQQ